MSIPSTEKEVSFVFPKSGNLFYEKKADRDFKFCKPILLPIRSVTLEKLEKMQLEAQKQMKVKTAGPQDS